MPELALTLLAVYGLLAFCLRMLVQLVRTGSTGFKGLSGAPGSAEWTSGLLVAGAIALCVIGAALQRGGRLEPVGVLDGAAGHLAGACLAVGGIALTVVAQFAMGRSWRVGVDRSERTELVTGGFFSVVRNPIYTAMLVTFLGVVLLAPNLVTLGGAVLLLIAVEAQTRVVEEPYLLEVHGKRYGAYAAEVGRFLPRVGRLR